MEEFQKFTANFQLEIDNEKFYSHPWLLMSMRLAKTAFSLISCSIKDIILNV